MKHLTKWMLPFALFSVAALADVSLREADATVKSFKKRDPKLAPLFTSSVGYIVFPEIKKGAFVFGGAGGDGVLYEHGVPTGAVKMTQVTVGAQVGGQTFSEIVFVDDDAALYRLKRGDASLSTNASAVAAGQERSATPQAENGLSVYTLPISGVMAEASVGGQKFEFTPYAQKPRS